MESKLRHIRIPVDVDAIVEQYRTQNNLKYFSDALFGIVRESNTFSAEAAASVLSAILADDIADRLYEKLTESGIVGRLKTESDFQFSAPPRPRKTVVRVRRHKRS